MILDSVKKVLSDLHVRIVVNWGSTATGLVALLFTIPSNLDTSAKVALVVTGIGQLLAKNTTFNTDPSK